MKSLSDFLGFDFSPLGLLVHALTGFISLIVGQIGDALTEFLTGLFSGGGELD